MRNHPEGFMDQLKLMSIDQLKAEISDISISIIDKKETEEDIQWGIEVRGRLEDLGIYHPENEYDIFGEYVNRMKIMEDRRK